MPEPLEVSDTERSDSSLRRRLVNQVGRGLSAARNLVRPGRPRRGS